MRLLAARAIEAVGPALHDSDACSVHRARLLDVPADAPSAGGRTPPAAAATVALKLIKISNAAAFDRYERERAVLQRADHPCIVKPLFIIEDAPSYGLVLPLAEHGSLSDMLHCAGRAPLPKELVLCFSDDLAGALDYVHSTLGMLHRDIKPANAVVDSAGRAVLIDFDCACPQGEQPGKNRRKGPSGGRHKDYMVGTLVYMAPELLRREASTAASDVYSLAISLNQMLTQCIPYSDVRTTTEQLHTVLEANYNEITLTSAICSEGLRPHTLPLEDEHCGPRSKVGLLLQRAWADAAASRPSAHGVRSELRAAARGLGIDVETLAVRQALLDAYHAQCLTHVDACSPLRAAEHASGTSQIVLGGTSPAPSCRAATRPGGVGSGDRPSLSPAAAALKLAEPELIAHVYDARTSVHRPPASTAKRFVWGGGAASCGRRGLDCMEDEHFVYHALDVFGDGQGRVDLFGVFDGHGGPAAAQHACRVLPFEVAAAMREEGDDVAAALTSAFRRAELSWCTWAEAAGEDSGCTALVVVVVHDVGLGGATMFSANCGDCRAVLSRCGSAVQMTEDHTPAVAAEAARVLAAGGCIVPARDGSLRVGGVIEVTRSLGDRRLKPLGLSPLPEVHSFRLQEGDDFVVLASDGVWGALSNACVLHKVAATVKHVDFGPKRVVSEAYEAGSDDNITALVVYLKPPPQITVGACSAQLP